MLKVYLGYCFSGLDQCGLAVEPVCNVAGLGP